MGSNAKIIKRRIKSIANTMKITKAMELVAASKMRNAINSVLNTRPYATTAWQTINTISNTMQSAKHLLLERNENAQKTLFVIFSADRGLAGGFNVNIIRTAISEIKKIDDSEIDVISIGRRGGDAIAKQTVNIIASFEGLSNKPKFEEILPISNIILAGYEAKKYKRVMVGYTDYISGLVQKPRIFELLPLGQPDKELGEVEGVIDDKNLIKGQDKYIFEPNAQEVLDKVLPRLVETMLYQSLLESSASEHSARMMAMRNATDAAKDMLNDLTFTYNRIRQTGITQEIAEISTGKAALEEMNN